MWNPYRKLMLRIRLKKHNIGNAIIHFHSNRRKALPKMMTVIVTVFDEAGLTVSDKKTETMLLRTPD